MSWDQLPLIGVQPATEQTIAQFTIPAGAGATFSATNNIATITTNAAHGLTMTPSGQALPNYYVSFGGSTSGISGTGILVGNYFRILSIPSITTFTIYTTITAATVTSMTTFPVFFPSFQTAPGNVGGNPLMGTTPEPFPLLAGCMFNIVTGANCQVLYFPTPTTGYGLIPLDAVSTTQLGGTPTTAPTARIACAVSSVGQLEAAYPWMGVVANGSTATTYISVIR